MNQLFDRRDSPPDRTLLASRKASVDEDAGEKCFRVDIPGSGERMSSLLNGAGRISPPEFSQPSFRLHQVLRSHEGSVPPLRRSAATQRPRARRRGLTLSCSTRGLRHEVESLQLCGRQVGDLALRLWRLCDSGGRVRRDRARHLFDTIAIPRSPKVSNKTESVDSGALFGGLATASAAMYGIPAGFYASRLISLSERAATLQREHGDIVNQQGIHGPDRETVWAARLRMDRLADLYELARDIRKASTLLTTGAVTLVVASLLPLAVTQIEQGWYAALVFVGFVTLGVLWVRDFRYGSHGLLMTTKVQYDLRKRKQEAGTAAGLSPLVSGDTAQMLNHKIVDHFMELQPEFAATREGRRMARKWKRSLRKRRQANF